MTGWRLISFQFTEFREAYFARRGYREAVVSQMDYIIIFDMRVDGVNVVGIFSSVRELPK